MTAAVFERFRKARTVQYLNDVLQILSEAEAEELNLKVKYTALQTAITALNEAWNPTLGSVFTAEIQQWDEQRDQLYTGFKGIVTVWARYHYDSEKKAAAEVLVNSLAHYTNGKELTRLPYQEETAELTALLGDLQTNESAALATLALTEWVNRMQTANNNFAEQYIARTKELSEQQQGIVDALRTEAVAAYRAMVKLLDARLAIAEEEEAANVADYQRIRQLLDQLAEQHNEAAKRTKAVPKGEEVTEDVVNNNVEGQTASD